mmetsp:Transcript_127566/g.291560  ORF Transcript_127566/g.291560 Transcript_127566/m.291560 type:complete len:730 (+) Transcript_127566:98-2287(+)
MTSAKGLTEQALQAHNRVWGDGHTPVVSARAANPAPLPRAASTTSQRVLRAVKREEAARILREHVEQGNPIRPSARANLWRSILRSFEGPTTVTARYTEWSGETDEPNQRVIRNDCQRTRAGVPKFKEASTQMHLEKMLTFFVKLRGIKYKQGINEVLAPFMYLHDENFSLDDVFECLQRFLHRFLPAVFADDEFHALQCFFISFRYLLLYHIPGIATILEEFEVYPELYVTPWFLTLFASKTELDVLLLFWDLYIGQGDPYLFPFIGMALLEGVQTKLSHTDESSMPEVLSRLVLGNREDVLKVFDRAMELRAGTPGSFIMRLRRASGVDGNVREEECFTIQEDELLRCCYPPGTLEPLQLEQRALDVKVLDARPASHFAAGHLPGSVHLEWRRFLDLAGAGSATHDLLLDQLGVTPDCHLVIITTTEDTRAPEGQQPLVLHLYDFFARACRRRFVSVVRDGWSKVVALVTKEKLQLHTSQAPESYANRGASLLSRAASVGVIQFGQGVVEDLQRKFQTPAAGDVTPSTPKASRAFPKPVMQWAPVQKPWKTIMVSQKLQKLTYWWTQAFTVYTNDGATVLVNADAASQTNDPDVENSLFQRGVPALSPVPCTLILTADHIYVTSRALDDTAYVTELVRHDVSTVHKITSKKSSQKTLCFYFTACKEMPMMILGFAELGVAQQCIEIVKATFQAARQRRARRSTGQDSSSAVGSERGAQFSPAPRTYM